MHFDNPVASILSPQATRIQFQEEAIDRFDLTAQKIAIFATNEYEGFSKNGGIGTYYATLNHKLSADGWRAILLLCQSKVRYGGQSHAPNLHYVFSTGEIHQVLDLQPIHQAILDDASQDFDRESWRCLFFIQAIAATFPDAVVYAELPAIWGFGCRAIQAKRAGALPSYCFTGITDHGGFEWLRETNRRYLTDDTRWLQQAYHVEQYSYDNADLTCCPSYFLRDKDEAYGWETDRAVCLPNFIPLISTEIPVPEVSRDIAAEIGDRVPIVFFGRLEERKGLLTFVEALQTYLGSESHNGNRPFVLFLGKIVPLDSTTLRGLDSREYIDRALDDRLDYRIESDLSSQEAIATILHLNAPIVCLCSLQENFPNTSLEMGQLPLSLIVADTGGFRETLDLLKRTDGVRWFVPGDRHSLARTFQEAIAVRPETPNVPAIADLEQTNQQLLERRLQLMTDTFLANPPKDLPTPRVTVGIAAIAEVDKLADCLESIAAQTYSNLEVIVIYDPSTQEAIAPVQTQFPNSQFVDFSMGESLGIAYNQLVKRSTGEYFLPLTLDRLLLPQAIETFVKAAGEAKAVIVTCPDMTLDEDDLEVITSIDGSLLKLLEFTETRDLCALFSVEWLRSYSYCEERELRALNWHLLAAAIATGETVAYYPYPLYLSDRDSTFVIPSETIPKERYYLRHFLSQIEPDRWTRRQLHLLLTCIEQLWQAESVNQDKLKQAQQDRGRADAQTAQAQAWMQTAIETQEELNTAQAELQKIRQELARLT